MLGMLAGPTMEIRGAQVTDYRPTDAGGFRFVLELTADFQISGSDILELDGLTPGDYLVEHQNAAFTVTPLGSTHVSLNIDQSAGESTASPVRIIINNTGSADSSDLTLVVEAESSEAAAIELTRTSVQALAGETTQVRVDIPSTLAAGGALRVRLEDGQGQVVATGEWKPLSGPDRSYRSAIYSIGKAPVLLPVAGLFAVLITLAALSAVLRRGGQPTP